MRLNNQICTFFITEICLLPHLLTPPPCVPSSETVSAHNRAPWWDQLSVRGHERIDLMQQGDAHVCARTHASWCAAPCVFVQGGPLGNQGVRLDIVISVVCVLVCSGHALKWELDVRRRESVCILCVSIKLCLFPMGYCIMEAAITLLSVAFFSSLHVTLWLLVASSSIQASSLHISRHLSFSFRLPFHHFGSGRMLYGLFVKAAPLLSLSSLFPSPRGIVGVQLFPSRLLDCCMFYKQRLPNACMCAYRRHRGSSPRVFITPLFLIFHLKRQITYSHPVLAAAMSAHLHKMPFFPPTAVRHTYSRVVANCSVWALNWFPLHYPAIGQLMLRVAREMEEDSGLQL